MCVYAPCSRRCDVKGQAVMRGIIGVAENRVKLHSYCKHAILDFPGGSMLQRPQGVRCQGAGAKMLFILPMALLFWGQLQ
jgi:hypothetical protein